MAVACNDIHLSTFLVKSDLEMLGYYNIDVKQNNPSFLP